MGHVAQHGGGGGGGHWSANVAPDFRDRVKNTIVERLVRLYDLAGIARGFDETSYSNANSLDEYFAGISMEMLRVEQRLQMLQPMQPPTDAAQWPATPLQLQTANYSSAQQQQLMGGWQQQEQLMGWQQQEQLMWLQQEQEQEQLMWLPQEQEQEQEQLMRFQLQQEQEQSMMLLQQQQQQQLMMRTNQEDPMSTQLHGAQQANAAEVQLQHMAQSSPASSLPCQDPQPLASSASTMPSDWKDGVLERITSLRNAHLAELMELDQAVVVPGKMTEEELQSLPREEARRRRCKGRLKASIQSALALLRLQRSSIPDNLKENFWDSERSLLELVRFHRERTRRRDRSTEVNVPSESVSSM